MIWLCSASDSPGSRRADPGGGPTVIGSRTSDGTVTVAIGGELDLVSMPLLGEHLAQALRGQPRALILDLSGVSFIDCGSARLLAETAAAALPPGERPVLRGPSACVRRVFQLTGLDAQCKIGD
jgi:anti-anti-sigma factor